MGIKPGVCNCCGGKMVNDLPDKKCHFYEMSRQNESQNFQTSSPKIIDSTI